MLISFHDDEVYSRCFKQFILDRGIELKSEADTRCAIKVYSNYIMNMLADFYDVDQQEGEE